MTGFNLNVVSAPTTTMKTRMTPTAPEENTPNKQYKTKLFEIIFVNV